ncbi:MAG: hypothetical protein E6K11_05835 [Methanobacteriota archaeon]|nr:MAG: hypothetical protein E6K11_05835 [Euryarchaeota archaeon]
MRYASAGASNGLGTSGLFALNPAIAVSSAFSFAGNPLPVPLTEICTENASAAMDGRRVLAATASVTWTQSGLALDRVSLSSATESFAPSSNVYVSVLRAAGFASRRSAIPTGTKNSAARGRIAWSRSYAVPLFATSSKPTRARCPNGEIVRRAFTYAPNSPRYAPNGASP